MNQPILFIPLAMERIWGGRELALKFGKSLPNDVPVGETWEIVDREEAQSNIAEGEWTGHSLHDLWQHRRVEIFGKDYAEYPSERFPILVKLLDARETLSVQVHPPAHRAAELHGEPKTEMWFLLHAEEDAVLYAGVKEGVSLSIFEQLLRDGNVENALLSFPVKTGESIFIPSGRLHAIGAGTVIAEIQQNSDTTYRVFDWNRVGLDGKARDLHIEESLASIDFEDHAPELLPDGATVLADCPYFRVERKKNPSTLPESLANRFVIWGVIAGEVQIGETVAKTGSFLLLPVGLTAPVTLHGAAEVLEITLPHQ